MKFDYTIDIKLLKLSKELEEKIVDNHQFSANVFENILKSIIPNGLQSAKSRSITRALNKLDIAAANNQAEVDLDVSEIVTLKEVFLNPDANVLPDIFRSFDYYCSKLESL